MRNHRWYQRCDLFRRLLLTEIECALMPEHFTKDHDRIDVRLFHLLCFIAGKKTHLPRQLQYSLVVIVDSGNNNVTIIVDKIVGVESSRSEVDQHQGFRIRII